MRIEPYPAFREKSGAPGEYNPPAEDGTRAGLFYINAYEPEKTTRADNESTAFHETIPGHHLQVAIAVERKEIHPIGRYIFNSGYVEGWALYAEQLADEMKLFSGDLDRLGHAVVAELARRAAGRRHRPARARLDAAAGDRLHARAHAAVADERGVGDRPLHHLARAGDRRTCSAGSRSSRRATRRGRRPGAAFDIKAFHDRVLEDGGVPLTFLREKIVAAAPR